MTMRAPDRVAKCICERKCHPPVAGPGPNSSGNSQICAAETTCERRDPGVSLNLLTKWAQVRCSGSMTTCPRVGCMICWCRRASGRLSAYRLSPFAGTRYSVEYAQRAGRAAMEAKLRYRSSGAFTTYRGSTQRPKVQQISQTALAE